MTAQRFAILSVPRSGTNYFVSKLAFLQGVLLAWEPFNNGLGRWFDETELFNSLPNSSRSALTDRNARDNNHEKFYEATFSPRSTILLPSVSALGFKLFPNHSPRLFWQIVADRGIKVIVLERKNRFDAFASYYMAVTSYNSKMTAMTEFSKKGVLDFDPIAFDLFVRFTDDIYEGLKVNLEINKAEFIHLYYEDVIIGEEAFVRSCGFIGVEYDKYDTELKKQITIPSHDLFGNTELLDDYLGKYYPQYSR